MTDATPRRSWLQSIADWTPHIAGICLILSVIGFGYWGRIIGGSIGAADCIRSYEYCSSYRTGANTGMVVFALAGLLIGLLQAAVIGMLHGIYTKYVGHVQVVAERKERVQNRELAGVPASVEPLPELDTLSTADQEEIVRLVLEAVFRNGASQLPKTRSPQEYLREIARRWQSPAEDGPSWLSHAVLEVIRSDCAGARGISDAIERTMKEGVAKDAIL